MISIHDWMRRRMREATGDPITADEEPMDPSDEDFSYYHTKIQGNAKKYLQWFLDEIEGKKLSLVRKGFIVQEVMNALDMNIGQYVRITSNIKHAMQKRGQGPGDPQQAGNQPQDNGAPAAAPETPPAAPAPMGKTDPNAAAQTPQPPATPTPGPMDKTNPGMKPPQPLQPQKKW